MARRSHSQRAACSNSSGGSHPSRRVLAFEQLEDRRLLAAGTLDPTFGIGGKVTTEFFRNALSSEQAYSVAVTPAGKIVVAGQSGDDFALARYNPDGTPDLSFDFDGTLTTSFGSGIYGRSVALQSDDKIVVAGEYYNSFGSYDFALARYNPNGTLDASFSGDGRVTTDFAGDDDHGTSVALQADGRIVVAGYSGSSNSVFSLARYNSDGTLDTSFDVDGKLTTSFIAADRGYSVAVQSDGRIVVAGRSWNGDDYDFSLMRCNADGTLDTSFDGDGKLTTDFSGRDDEGWSITLQDDGKIIFAGASGLVTDFAMARYNADGSLDLSFSGDGKLTTSFSASDDDAYGVVVQADGKIVVVGTSGGNFALARYNVDGTLDTSFDTDGKLTTNFSANEFGRSVALQSDGKIIAAGYSSNSDGSRSDFALARYNANGSLDTSFDADGKLTTNFGKSDDLGRSVAVQSDGKIVVAGSSSEDFALARYNADGTLDTTFDADGKVATNLGSNDFGRGVALQSDGKIIVAGYSGNYPNGNFAVARYNVDGSLDASFGGGAVTTDFGSSDDNGLSVVLQSDGKIIVAGQSYKSGIGTDFALVRYNTNGTLDTSFDGDGKLTTDFGATADYGYSVVLQSDGKIVVAGASYGTGNRSDFALARYNPDGTLDLSFDGDGKVRTDFGGLDDNAYCVVIQNDGKILVAGGGYNSSSFALARYNADGTLDTSFDTDGKVATNIGNSDDVGYGLVLQDDGKIVVAGYSGIYLSSDRDFALARYNANGMLDTSFDGDGKATTDFGASAVGYGLALQSDGTIVVVGSSLGDIYSDFALARYEGDSPPPPALLGDYNLDGTVDAADYTLWRDTLSTAVATYSGADGDGDGTIDQDDHSVWRENFGNTNHVPTLAGDYNFNGVVDAADYSVWRDTVGVANDLRADGSGAAIGVPDGVVDEHDYDFWKANFGNVFGAGSGGHVAASLRDAVENRVSERLDHVTTGASSSARQADGWEGTAGQASSGTLAMISGHGRTVGSRLVGGDVAQSEVLVVWLVARTAERAVDDDAVDSPSLDESDAEGNGPTAAFDEVFHVLGQRGRFG